MKRLEREWLSYRAKVVPAGAGEVQVEETRHAFYAGAASLYGVVMNMLDPVQETTENDIQRMEDLQSELIEFGATIQQGGRTAH